mgnify:CR=1 FL=1
MDDIINEMREYLTTSEDFREYVAKDMEMYHKTITEVLTSPITQEYYKQLKGAEKK